MRLGKNSKTSRVSRLFKLISFACFIAGAAFVVLLVLSGIESVQYWWQTYQDFLTTAQIKVENMEDKGFLFLTLMFLFGFKAFWPLYPLSLLVAVTGVVFPFYIAIPINIAGMILHYSLKYVWGKRMGPGGVNLILKKNETLSRFIKMNDTGNPWLLVIFRLIPFIPVNPVSQLYGSMGFDYGKFLLLSLAGYMPLLCSYTLVGRNAYNPLSAGFLIPLMVLAFAGSAVAYIISIILNYQKYRSEKHDSN